MSVFVSAETLHEHIQSGKRHTIIATLWDAKPGKSWSKFQSEHIPTAVFCDPASQLSGMPGRRVGRNPLPDALTVEKAVRAWGVEPNRPIFLYDGGNGLFAARAWWVLRWAGFDDVHILDGGFAAWDGSGLPTVAGPGNVVVPREIEVTTGHLPTAQMDDVREFQGKLIDARSPRRFQGRREVLDLQAGHIPGAVNLPVGDLFDEVLIGAGDGADVDGAGAGAGAAGFGAAGVGAGAGVAAGEYAATKVKSPEEIRARLAEAGITESTTPEEAIVYSGSGNHSALLLAAMEHAGLPVLSHYVAGWSQWSADPHNPVSTDL